jgi:Zn-dependent protease
MTAQLWVIYIGVLIPSIVLHEVSHGFVANICGDPTAKNAGRLTLNPLKHLDPFGSVLLPIIMVLLVHFPIGYAKPVPVNVSRLRDPRNQSVYVSLAGPLVNAILVVIAWAYCRIVFDNTSNLTGNWLLVGRYLGLVNVFLFLYNMLPIPPLDGSAVVERLVPRRHLHHYFRIRAQALGFALILTFLFLHSQYGNSIFLSIQTWWNNLIT